jgi:hypothetical protein
VPCNPTSMETMASESVSVPSDNFCANGTQAVKSYHLRITVTASRKSNSSSTSRPSTRSRESNSSDLGNVLMYLFMASSHLCIASSFLLLWRGIEHVQSSNNNINGSLISFLSNAPKFEIATKSIVTGYRNDVLSSVNKCCYSIIYSYGSCRLN